MKGKDHTLHSHTDETIGKMAVADVRGTYSNAAVKLFYANTLAALEDNINGFYRENPGLIVVNMHYMIDAAANHVVAAYTHSSQLSDEYIAELNEVQQEVSALMAERKAKRLEAELKADEEEAERLKAERALIEVGKKCKEHHAPLVEENRKLKEVNKKLAKAGG